jgi:hypothetical protein
MTNLDAAAVMRALADDARLRVFLRGGSIEALPARRSRRILLLDAIAQGFEPGVRYAERDVDEFLRKLHPDHAALRRHLVDEGFLSRAGGEYWRSGGTVLINGDRSGT